MIDYRSMAPRPMAPLLGGKYTREKALHKGGWCVPPTLFPTYSPSPGWPPILGVLVGTSRESWENSILLLPEYRKQSKSSPIKK